MKEFIQLGGIRRWHGDEFIAIQKGILDQLQSFYEPYGNVIISGCQIVNTVPGYKILDGYIGCRHADGYKIAKVSEQLLGAAGLFPFYLSIGKTTQSKVYEDLVTRNSSITYSAVIGNTVPAGDYITVNTSGGATWRQAVLSDGWQYVGAVGKPPFLNSFGNGYTSNPGIVDNLRFCKVGKFVHVGGALDYDALSISTLNTYVNVCQLVGYAPDRVRFASMSLSTMAGAFGISIRVDLTGMLACCVTSIPSGAVMADITSGSPYGDYFELNYPTA